MQANRILPAFDPSARCVLPAAMAVRAPRFDHAIAATAREVSDLFDLDRRVPAPPAVELDAAESIVMAGNEIVNSLRTGSHVVRQRRTVDFATLPELAIVESPAFERVAPTLRQEAAAALDRLASRRPTAQRHAVSAPPSGLGWTVVAWLAAAVSISAGLGAVLSLL